ncbi:CDP-glucose 4,6-dehydratase (plasmid) [Exiguobacterium sp. Helios]|uniref:CDP-glucose 4,6-dehydratase n=1 Tax=Exiguobacterium sp. Helios TaxID=2735868 RepID=UPI00165D7899|nr:CDP-glucose 4,6-dehydratase [Exiguobacterium sp. Helios]QNR22510.1 CDP-glucose 4,6-dehydratase [Exiguobacterium sp. Helios]
MSNDFRGFYKGKTILVTGHTGFKGSWLSLWLVTLGAKVVGIGLKPNHEKDNFVKTNLSRKMTSIEMDIKEKASLEKIIEEHRPSIIFHLAAQPLVQESILTPYETIEDNVMGTLNILECIKKYEFIKSSIIVTSDKTYENKEQIWGYREIDHMGGKDPYSASKAAVEILTHSYMETFYSEQGTGVATVRAGNVIGGGDWSKNRIIPDTVKFALENQRLQIRNPDSIRPWQHVLEPLSGYLLLAYKLFDDPSRYSSSWNFGPNKESMVSVEKLVSLVSERLKNVRYEVADTKNSETAFLNLDYSKSYFLLGWEPRLSIRQAVEMTIDWYNDYEEKDMYDFCSRQILDYSEMIFGTADIGAIYQ